MAAALCMHYYILCLHLSNWNFLLLLILSLTIRQKMTIMGLITFHFFGKNMSNKEESAIELEGTVLAALRDSKFSVQIDTNNENKHIVLAHLSGKLKKNFIKIVPGDKVTVEVTTYDLTRGRIIYRNR